MSLAGFHTSMTVAWIARDYHDIICTCVCPSSCSHWCHCSTTCFKHRKCIFIPYVCAIQPVTINVGAAKCLTASAFPCHSALDHSIQRLIVPLSLTSFVCLSCLCSFSEKNHGDLAGRNVRTTIQLVIWWKWMRGFEKRGGLGRRICFHLTVSANPKLQPMEDSDLLLTCVHH